MLYRSSRLLVNPYLKTNVNVHAPMQKDRLAKWGLERSGGLSSRQGAIRHDASQGLSTLAKTENPDLARVEMVRVERPIGKVGSPWPIAPIERRAGNQASTPPGDP